MPNSSGNTLSHSIITQFKSSKNSELIFIKLQESIKNAFNWLKSMKFQETSFLKWSKSSKEISKAMSQNYHFTAIFYHWSTWSQHQGKCFLSNINLPAPETISPPAFRVCHRKATVFLQSARAVVPNRSRNLWKIRHQLSNTMLSHQTLRPNLKKPPQRDKRRKQIWTKDTIQCSTLQSTNRTWLKIEALSKNSSNRRTKSFCNRS